MKYDFWTSNIQLAGSRKRKWLSCKHVQTFMKNRGLFQAQKMKPRSKENHSQTLRPNQIISESLWTSDSFMAPISPIFKQECLYQLQYTCCTVVFWECGEQILCFFSFTGLRIKRYILKRLYLRIYSRRDSSTPTLDMDDEVPNLELML